MKTPPELLLAKHEGASTKLDAMRRRVIAGMVTPKATTAEPRATGSSVMALLAAVWNGLIWPSQRAWATITIIWAGVLVWNAAATGGSLRSEEPRRTGANSQVVQSLVAQRHLLSEMLEPVPQPPTAPARAKTQPRTDILSPFRVC